jgi:site-specific recombinase XerD
MEALLMSFLEELRLHRYSKSLLSISQRVLSRLFGHLEAKGVTDIRSVNEVHLLRFVRELATTPTWKGTPPALQSQNAYVNALRRFFSFLEKRGTILTNPARFLPFQKIRTLPRAVLSERQVERLIHTPLASTLVGKRDQAILELLYGTAIRLTECGRLDVADLDLRHTTLLIRNGKGMKDRMVPVPGRAAAALDRYLTEVRPQFLHAPRESALFLSRVGTRLSTASIGLLVKRYGEDAGVRVSPHGLRHACATHLIRRGADIRHVQKLLGHRDIQTTAIYTGVALKDLQELLERAHPQERSWRKKRKRC